MILRTLVLFLALFALTRASPFDESTTSLKEEDVHLLDQEFGIVPEYDVLSEEEWIKLSKGVLQGNIPLEFLQTKNYTFQVNGTGSISVNDGTTGSWNMTSLMMFSTGEDEGRRRIITSESIIIGGVQLTRGTVSTTSYTYLNKTDITGYAKVHDRVTFLWHENGTAQLLIRDDGAATGVMGFASKREMEIADTCTCFRNYSVGKQYSVQTIMTSSQIIKEKIHNIVQCARNGQSIPLGKPNQFDTIVHLLKNSDWASNPVSIYSFTSGYFNATETGRYYMSNTHEITNWKTSDKSYVSFIYNGTYRSLGTQVEERLLPSYEQGLLELISRDLF